MHSTEFKIQQSAIILAALYHESGRTSVAAGDTLAHSAGQAKPFTEFGHLSAEAREGRLMTAANLERRVRFSPEWPPTYVPGDGTYEDRVDELAHIIHEAERDAIEAGKVVVKLNPPRPWIPFEQLPDVAQAGRRRQAGFFLDRFIVETVG